MTNHVLSLHSWERFVTMGVFDPDPVALEAIDVDYQADVLNGYLEQNCFAATDG
jgi:hypothetical protein